MNNFQTETCPSITRTPPKFRTFSSGRHVFQLPCLHILRGQSGDGSQHFDTKEKLLKAFGLTEARLDYLLVSGAQAYRGYFFDEEISSRRGSKSNIE